MDIGIPVEVEGVYGEFYPGTVCGLTSLGAYHVRLVDPSHSCSSGEVCLPPESMRLPPEITNFPFDPMQGQEVDVLIPCLPPEVSNEGDGCPLSKLSAWWPGKVRKVGGGFVIVELVTPLDADPLKFKDSNTIEIQNGRIAIPRPTSVEKTDIVEKHQLRPRSHQVNFTASSFHMHAIDIPDELEIYCKDPSNYQHFARRCGLPVLVCMAPESLKPAKSISGGDGGDTFEKKARLLVISTDPATVKRAAVIDNTFIDMLRQKVLILQQTEELSRKLEASRISQDSAPFVEDLHVPDDLIHHAIGIQGSNIRRAQSIPGIISIKLNRATCVFRISGKTEEVVQQAKAMLDYAVETIPVPRCYVAPIVGSGQRHIQHIVDCLELRGLKIYDMPEPELSQYAAFQLTGTKQSIKDACMFLEFHVASLQDLDKLRGISPPPTIPSFGELRDKTDSHEHPISSCEVSNFPPRHRSGRSQRTRQKSATLSNGNELESINENPVDRQPLDESKNRSSGSQRPRPSDDGDHSRSNLKSRQRRAANQQTNNSFRRDPPGTKGMDRRPTGSIRPNAYTECNGYGKNLTNGTIFDHCSG